MKPNNVLILIMIIYGCSNGNVDYNSASESGQLAEEFRNVLTTALDTSFTDFARSTKTQLDSVRLTETELDSLVRISAEQPEVLVKIVADIIAELQEKQISIEPEVEESKPGFLKKTPVSDLDTVSTPTMKRFIRKLKVP